MPLKRINPDSIGLNLCLNAEGYHRREKPKSCILFDAAATRLEEELGDAPLGSPQRKEILENLLLCYHRLCVESAYPPNLRSAPLSGDNLFYNRKAQKISQEL